MPIMLIADIAIEGAIWLTAASIDAVDKPLVLDPTRTWQVFTRKDAVRALAALSEENRHRMFVAGFRKMAPYKGSEATLNKMLEEDAEALHEAFRTRWERHCNQLIPNG
jgi:hypothetical protein